MELEDALLTTAFSDEEGQALLRRFQNISTLLFESEQEGSDDKVVDVGDVICKSLLATEHRQKSMTNGSLAAASLTLTLRDLEVDDELKDAEATTKTKKGEVTAASPIDAGKSVYEGTDDEEAQEEEGLDQSAKQQVRPAVEAKNEKVVEKGIKEEEEETEETKDEEEEEGVEVEEEVEEEDEDEWENDDDLGVVMLTISEDEFFEMEEEASNTLSVTANLQKEVNSWAQAGADEAEEEEEEDEEGNDSELERDIEKAELAIASSSSSATLPSAHDVPPPPPTTLQMDDEPMSPVSGASVSDDYARAQLAEMLVQGGFSSPLPMPPPPPTNPDDDEDEDEDATTTTATKAKPLDASASSSKPSSSSSSSSRALHGGGSKKQSMGERRRSEIMGQHRFIGPDGPHAYFQLKVIFEPNKTGFEETKAFNPPPGTVIAGRYEVGDVLGTAAFSTALQCADLLAEEDEPRWVCLKVIKNSKDFFDQSMDEIKLLQFINSRGEPDENHVLRLIDFFYYKVHTHTQTNI